MFNPVAPYRYLLPNLYLSVADIANPDLFACSSCTWISLVTARFYEEHCQPSSGSAWPACPKKRCRHNLHRVCQTAVTSYPLSTNFSHQLKINTASDPDTRLHLPSSSCCCCCCCLPRPGPSSSQLRFPLSR